MITAGVIGAVGLASQGYQIYDSYARGCYDQGDQLLGNLFGASIAGYGVSQLAAAGQSVAGGSSQVTEGTKVYRVFGENNNPLGQSWTRVDPSSIPNFRNAAGLPDVNTGRFVIEGQVTDITGITTRQARPLNGNIGGLDEVVIPNATS